MSTPRKRAPTQKDAANTSAAAAAATNPKITSKDVEIDKAVVTEFGGSLGVTAMMLGFPLLMYYLWLSVHLHRGHLAPLFLATLADPASFFRAIVDHAFPTAYAWKIYGYSTLMSAALAYVMPGPVVKGLPLPSRNGAQLEYLCNGISSFYVTLAISAGLHYYGVFPLTDIFDNIGPIMSVAVITGFAVSALMYFGSTLFGIFGAPHRMSGRFFYDFFMGAPLNPRIGRLDFKMWAEIRVPWVILFYVSLSCAIKQRELVGHFTPEATFMVLAHLLYVNACMKGEECIPTTWDIFYEKFGFMLIFWNLAGVPFSYCLGSLYLVERGPLNHPVGFVVPLYAALLIAYYVWDTANSQKNRFRMVERGTYIPRRTFPQLPWGTLTNPKVLRTKSGSTLLVDGWYKYARKIHYTADLVMALSWGLIAGFDSFVPYFYFTFFVAVLIHRVSRDMEKCARKYGDDWVAYCKEVPYVFIPGVY